MIAACARKEWRDHRGTLAQGAVILTLFTVFFAFAWPLLGSRSTPGSRTGGLTAMILALAAVIWLGGIVAMVLAPDGEKCGAGFLERQPAGMARIFAGKISFVVLSLFALWISALVLTGLATLLCLDPLDDWLGCAASAPAVLLPLCVFAAGALAFGPLVQRGVLAVAGGPILLVPIVMVWSSYQLPIPELAHHPFAEFTLVAAGLATAAAGFVWGRRLLAPANRAARFGGSAAALSYGLALLPVAHAAANATNIDPEAMVIDAGSIDTDGVTTLRVHALGSTLPLRATLEPRGLVLEVDPKPLQLRKGPPRQGLSLRDRLNRRDRRQTGIDNLARTTAGLRYWIENDKVCIESEDGTTRRIDVGYSELVAVRGDALLVRHEGLAIGHRERCRILDLHLQRAFSSPLVDPDGFIAVGGTWYLADVELEDSAPLIPRAWRRYDAPESEPVACAELRDGDRVIAAERGGTLLLSEGSRVLRLDPESGQRVVLSEDAAALPRGNSPSLLVDGTQLFVFGGNDAPSLAALVPGAQHFGPRVPIGLLIGALMDDVVLTTTVDRRRLQRVHLSDARIDLITPTVTEARR